MGTKQQQCLSTVVYNLGSGGGGSEQEEYDELEWKSNAQNKDETDELVRKKKTWHIHNIDNQNFPWCE